MDELVSEFRLEASEALSALQASFARLVGARDDAEARGDIKRRLHALKGLCGLAGFDEAEARVHALESAMADPQLPVAALCAGALPALEGIARLVDAPARLARPEGERRAAPPWSGLSELVRSLGDRLGKRIELMIGGDDVRIAEPAIAPLRIALVALARNACDHGVEDPSVRRARGKPTLARLRLGVLNTRDGLCIEFADDGCGVDPDRVRERAIELGLVGAAAATAMCDTAAQALVFDPGFSLSAVAQPLSGRGVGLEVVRREVEALGGRVDLVSRAGEGARFILTLPATVLAGPSQRDRAAA